MELRLLCDATVVLKIAASLRPSPHYNTENGAIRKRSPEWSDLKTMLFENVF